MGLLQINGKKRYRSKRADIIEVLLRVSMREVVARALFNPVLGSMLVSNTKISLT